jgi:ketosteroid isomerase-like protein
MMSNRDSEMGGADDASNDIQVVQAVYGAMAAGDVARLFELVDESCVITQDARLPWGGRYVGRDGLATFGLRLREAIQSSVTTHAVFAADGDVVQVGRTAGTTVATGTPFDIAEVHRWTIADGRVVAAHFSIDTPGMLDALGNS